MRTHGTLKKWNEDRGFGFIAPAEGTEELFVHISEFPRAGGRPRLNEVVSYETEQAADGKRRAVRVLRPGQQSQPSHSRSAKRSRRRSGLAKVIVTVVVIAAIGAYGYRNLEQRKHASPDPQQAASVPALSAPSPSPFQCDGRTMCSQMRSCAEARYFLNHCPGTQMDGDDDGEPCEQQWCN